MGFDHGSHGAAVTQTHQLLQVPALKHRSADFLAQDAVDKAKKLIDDAIEKAPDHLGAAGSWALRLLRTWESLQDQV